ncbi:hypothetical protein R3W88_016243 [Solanum pinnatisectum]|uniref:RNase H type-1 domain-containing protein n=1 Tax=Solanum pinnatisectum TaxID=50273 RepID=A0AAV9KZY8_9SOLN|nr:hypothetical protein R3W88_016243 [Solanum pinnatisectum]
MVIRVRFPGISIGNSWPNIVNILGNHKPRLYHHIVQWKFPREGQLKCNTDGASKGNPGESAYGFCFKDKHGDLIYAQAKGIAIATNIEVEARAIQAALSISAKKGFQNLVIETDSMSLMKMILKTWRIPWKIAEILEYIIREVEQQQVTIKHIYREGNQMAYYLANLAIGQTEIQEYENFTE